ncbi:MAG TPA: hypothetical protein VIG69_06115 [Candidatus Methylomirabilis sp.]|jgi:hypothetical protein
MNKIVATLGALALCGLVSCSSSTKEDIIGKTRNVSTRDELEKAVGKPSDIAKLGPVEQWTYKASNGNVVFVIVGDKVTLQAAGPPEKQN